MKEKIIEIMTFGYGLSAEEEDIDAAATDIEHLVNQEVERRIVERMPMLIKYWSRRRVVDDPDLEELLRLDDLFKSIYQANRRIDFGTAADMGMECVIKEIFRSRLTNDSQKTEGGE